MNKAIIGNSFEIDAVKLINKNKPQNIFNKLGSDSKNTFAIHITKHKVSLLSNRLISCKSDLYFVYKPELNRIISNSNFYLNEEDVLSANLIPDSGTSIKLPNSKYTICKLSINSFQKIFSNKYIGCGAMIYSMATNDNLIKNRKIIEAWNCNEHDLKDYFQRNFNLPLAAANLQNGKFLDLIKKYSSKSIKKHILENDIISDMIFQGKGIFEDPYYAKYIYNCERFVENKLIDFLVTTGSGRSKGDYTIVIKPI